MSSRNNLKPATPTSRNPLTRKLLAVLPRRTQAERLAETRSRIIAATVSYIDERGFHQTSLQQIAKVAGVTVGAVQHHFANKMELLTAVVEDSFGQLAESMRNVAFEGASLEERIKLFVDQCWDFCNSPRYQASLHILLGMRSDHGEPEKFESWLHATLGRVMSEGFDRWREVFGDVALDEQEQFDTLLYLFSSLSGTSLLARISQSKERVANDLRVLNELLLLKFRQARRA